MATISQIDANRQNAKKSTGPRSAEGKAASSQNALKSGIDAQSLIIRGENLSDLEVLKATYQDRFQPATPEQIVQVDTLIHNDWLLRRLRKIEPEIWEKDFQRRERYDEYKKDYPLGDGVCRIDQTLSRLQRRIDSTERSYHRALKALQSLRPDCFEPQTDSLTTSEADPAPAVTALVPTEIGFVPQPPPKPAEASGPRPDAMWSDMSTGGPTIGMRVRNQQSV